MGVLLVCASSPQTTGIVEKLRPPKLLRVLLALISLPV